MSGFDIRWDAERQTWFAFDGARLIECKDKSKLEDLLDYVEAYRKAQKGPSAEYWKTKFESLERALYAAGLEVYGCSVCGCRMAASPTGKGSNVCVECQQAKGGGD